jgi:hypothetical protein
MMGYLGDLKELERDHPPAEDKRFAKRAGRKPEPYKPEKLAEYRDQRLNGTDGLGSYEPDVT